ncbi:MAG: hypothetical protein ABIQ65_00310 [Thermoanaerobaculia bacterium]
MSKRTSSGTPPKNVKALCIADNRAGSFIEVVNSTYRIREKPSTITKA